MCMSSPKMPAITETQRPQEVKQVEQGAFGSTSQARNNMTQAGGMAASTMLTGPSGVERGQMQLGKSTLLGQ
jgi:hypothetical protein